MSLKVLIGMNFRIYHIVTVDCMVAIEVLLVIPALPFPFFVTIDYYSLHFVFSLIKLLKNCSFKCDLYAIILLLWLSEQT